METNYTNFFIVRAEDHQLFANTIAADYNVHELIIHKAMRNPFYLDFLKDCWLLFYNEDILLKDPEKCMYMQIRNTLFDLITNDNKLKLYSNLSSNNALLSLKYATLYCEVLSITFKRLHQDPKFAYNCDIISYYYNAANSESLGIIKTSTEAPVYSCSQNYINQLLLKDPATNRCEISRLFHTYCYQNISQLEILQLNDESVLTLFEYNPIT